MEKVPEYKNSIVQVPAADLPLVLHATTSRGEEGTNAAQKYKNLDMTAVVKACKGKGFFLETKESLPDVDTSFSVASHPPEPVDVDLMRTVYVSIDGNRPDAGCLIKGLSVNGSFIEDLSVRDPGMKPNASPLSSIESLVEEARPSGTLPSPLSVDKASQSMDNTYLMQDSTEKECVWDASLPPSSNVSPLSSIGSTIVTTKSAINSCSSTYRSDGVTSDGILSGKMNCESTKASAMGDLVESAKTSMSRASDSSGLSDDSNWSNITGTFCVQPACMEQPSSVCIQPSCFIPRLFSQRKGVGSSSKRLVGNTDSNSGGKYLDFEFF
ncbi:hypothetical protein M5K25_027177 [Dendrobium thyrsiflorum]|uniref:Uncharacterized protein n=1 Tax=Dendrobium thyrsiflorum TaxID=117978 RepID=A0ABD0TZI3_DENTH